MPPPLTPPADIGSKLQVRDGRVVFVEPGAEPPRGDSQPETPRGGVPSGPVQQVHHLEVTCQKF